MSDTEYLRRWLKQFGRYNWSYRDFKDNLNRDDPMPENSSPTADDWQEFKRKFVEEYGGETVQEDGLTHREFLEYIKTGYTELSELDSKPDILTMIKKRQGLI